MLTRVRLKPLRKISQLKNLGAFDCVGCERSGSLFTLTFQIIDNDGNELLQDLSIEFSRGKMPKLYISDLGNEDIWKDLTTLCPICHRKIHNMLRRRQAPE